MTNRIRNTTKDMQDPLHAMAHLLASSGPGGSSRAIVDMEKDGQRQLCESLVLPARGLTKSMNAFSNDDAALAAVRAKVEALGFKIGEPVSGDPMFVQCEFPPGWKLVGTDHDMWSNLVDDKGRKRAGVFYKAAYYDRSAHIRFTPRYTYTTDYDRPQDGPQVCRVIDSGDGDKVLHTAEVGGDDEYHNLMRIADDRCRAWLAEHFPNHADPFEYW